MNAKNFHKSKLIYNTLAEIQKERDLLVRDLVAYTNDSVRYQRRIRMLINLSEYEKQILEKIRDFDPDWEIELDMIAHIKFEISCIVNRDA